MSLKILILTSSSQNERIVRDEIELEYVRVNEIVYNKIDLSNINPYKIDFVIFTSPISVDSFRIQIPNFMDYLRGKIIITIGKKTKERLNIDSIVIEKFNRNELEKYVGRKGMVMVVKSENTQMDLIKMLEGISKKIYVVNAYKNKNNIVNYSEIFNRLKEKYYEGIIFLSSQIFETYVDIFSYFGDPIEILPMYVIAVGTNTAMGVKKYGIDPIIIQTMDINEAIKILKERKMNNS
ncbi:MAG: uroporphyrinogen-III synthase [Thermoplasmata archaeon]